MRPARTAGLIAGSYLLAAAAYILISSTFASEQSGTVEELRRIEITKGLAFVVGSAGLLFVLNITALRRIQQNELRTRRMERALHNAERSVLAGTFARTIAHDINNGLSVATLSLALLRESVADVPEQRELADDIDEALRRIAEWNRRFFEIGGRQLVNETRPLDLCASLQAATQLARQHRKLRLAQLDVATPAEAPYLGIDSIIQRAVLNLVLNAADAAGERARVLVTLAATEPGHWAISVEDNGPGVPAKEREQILEPFFTTKPDGTGLGLASVVACARFHGGDVRVDDSPLGGARFVLRLGAVPPREESPSA